MCSCAEGPRPLYRVEELAEMAGMTRWQVRRLLARNDVPLVRSGRRVFVPLAALRAALPWVWDSLVEARAT